MIRAVLFDLDRTLLDRDTSLEAFAGAQYRRLVSHFPGVKEDDYIRRFITLDARGLVVKEQVYDRLAADLALTTISGPALYADFDTHIASHYVPFPKMQETLEALSRCYLLGLITNGREEFQKRTIDALGIISRFKVILISEIEGLRKPDPAIFLRALAQMDCPPEEAVYVGDHPVSDIQGARSAGMKAVWKRNIDFPDPSAEASIDQLDELPAVLASLDLESRNGD